MIYDIDFIEVMDLADELNQMILQSESYQAYKKAFLDLSINEEVQQLKNELIRIKERYDEVNRFGRYHPDYQRVMLETRKKKKEYDMHPEVAQVKLLETQLQTLLDEVLIIIASSVSAEVKVEKGNPFFESHTCSSGCGCS
ncbi:YlbF family regulator [Macrococcoides goetzii]|uniref:YlbF family regulator n=1 Tax=Macrococcoides goetzii TaxID=1891097 RepID=UPI001F0C67B7|nr:YlbF family regulator [Macrococcus goetzii]